MGDPVRPRLSRSLARASSAAHTADGQAERSAFFRNTGDPADRRGARFAGDAGVF